MKVKEEVREIAEQEYPEMKPTTELTFQEILNNLISRKDYDLKTEIKNPKALSKLKVLSIAYKLAGLEKCHKTLETFIEWYLVYMISKDRGSRKEIRDILISIMSKRESTTIGEKLRTNLK